MAFALNNSFLLSDQDINQFWCRRGLNLRFLIQPSETLPVEVTGGHKCYCSIMQTLKSHILFSLSKGWYNFNILRVYYLNVMGMQNKEWM